MLEPVINSLEEVAEPLRAEYKPLGDGRFVLDTNVEAHPGVAALKNTVANVRAERNQAKEDLVKFQGIDPAKYQILLEQERKVKEGELIAAGKLDDLVALRTGALREDLTGQLTTEKARSEKLQADMDRLVIDNAVHAAAAKVGVKKSAVDDVLSRARSVFKAKDGTAVAFKDGNPVYAKDGQSLLGIEEWLGALPAQAPHLFEDSKGGGAPGGATVVKPAQGPNVIPRSDTNAFLQNLDAVAKGKTKVIM